MFEMQQAFMINIKKVTGKNKKGEQIDKAIDPFSVGTMVLDMKKPDFMLPLPKDNFDVVLECDDRFWELFCKSDIYVTFMHEYKKHMKSMKKGVNALPPTTVLDAAFGVDVKAQGSNKELYSGDKTLLDKTRCGPLNPSDILDCAQYVEKQKLLDVSKLDNKECVSFRAFITGQNEIGDIHIGSCLVVACGDQGQLGLMMKCEYGPRTNPPSQGRQVWLCVSTSVMVSLRMLIKRLTTLQDTRDLEAGEESQLQQAKELEGFMSDFSKLLFLNAGWHDAFEVKDGELQAVPRYDKNIVHRMMCPFLLDPRKNRIGNDRIVLIEAENNGFVEGMESDKLVKKAEGVFSALKEKSAKMQKTDKSGIVDTTAWCKLDPDMTMKVGSGKYTDTKKEEFISFMNFVCTLSLKKQTLDVHVFKYMLVKWVLVPLIFFANGGLLKSEKPLEDPRYKKTKLSIGTMGHTVLAVKAQKSKPKKMSEDEEDEGDEEEEDDSKTQTIIPIITISVPVVAYIQRNGNRVKLGNCYFKVMEWMGRQAKNGRPIYGLTHIPYLKREVVEKVLNQVKNFADPNRPGQLVVTSGPANSGGESSQGRHGHGSQSRRVKNSRNDDVAAAKRVGAASVPDAGNSASAASVSDAGNGASAASVESRVEFLMQSILDVTEKLQNAQSEVIQKALGTVLETRMKQLEELQRERETQK